MTTIGYGDLHPTNTATRVLLFPFLLMTVGVLGYEIVLVGDASSSWSFKTKRPLPCPDSRVLFRVDGKAKGRLATAL